ncbi:hypothetical protein BDF22DRAFT_655880 [Syncephalis plumigaleata]|nr:hypothetical protein BDF22DRAFT_655880 [Syncephalis plumigaleata]
MLRHDLFIYTAALALVLTQGMHTDAATLFRRDATTTDKFLEQPLATLNAFGQDTLIIEKVLEIKHGVHYASGKYQNKPVRIACGDDSKNDNNHELLVLKDLKKASEALKKQSDPGYEHLTHSIHDFKADSRQCYITSAQCDYRLDDTKAVKVDPAILSNTKSPVLGVQHLQALHTLRKIAWSYGDALPESYCINVDKEKGLQLVIGNFEKADYLKISGTQGVTISRFVELVNWHTAYLIMLSNSFINDWIFAVGGPVKSRYLVTQTMDERTYGHILKETGDKDLTQAYAEY